MSSHFELDHRNSETGCPIINPMLFLLPRVSL